MSVGYRAAAEPTQPIRSVHPEGSFFRECANLMLTESIRHAAADGKSAASPHTFHESQETGLQHPPIRAENGREIALRSLAE